MKIKRTETPKDLPEWARGIIWTRLMIGSILGIVYFDKSYSIRFDRLHPIKSFSITGNSWPF